MDGKLHKPRGNFIVCHFDGGLRNFNYHFQEGLKIFVVWKSSSEWVLFTFVNNSEMENNFINGIFRNSSFLVAGSSKDLNVNVRAENL